MNALVHAIDNRGPRLLGRSFPGLSAPGPGQTVTLNARQARLFDLAEGDLISLNGMSDAHSLRVIAFDMAGRDALPSIGLSGSAPFPETGFDKAELLGWMSAHGLPDTDRPGCAPLGTDEDLLILRATHNCSVWILSIAEPSALIDGVAPGEVTLSVTRAMTGNIILPPPLGQVRDEFTIARGTAQAYELNPGEVVQIIDVEGQQCSDFMAFHATGLEQSRVEMIDNTATRSMVRRAFPGPGLFDKFYDAEMRPLLNVVQDTCGRHDTYGLACTARSYEERGFPGHVNCSDNISDSMAPYGVPRRGAWPAINFFWNTWVEAHNQHILTEESWSRPGDYVALHAIEPLVCVSTACPDDIDPINGWNPTDVHVRIYRPDTPIRRAIAHREKETAPMTLSQETAFHPATSKLTRDFAPARNLWVPTSYSSVGTLAEYWACRDTATLQDMSALRKFDIIGPDAERLLQLAMTRNVAKLAQWRGTYTLLCDMQGEVIDDGTLFRLGPQLFRWCCGSEESARHLSDLADEHGYQVRINAHGDVLPNLALQGPKSREILRKIVFTQPHVPTLDELKWFGVTTARIGDREGLPFMLSRSGYTGELGYELFCSVADAPKLWEAVMEAGQEFGLKPMGGAALETIRIEAGLAAAGAEFTAGVDAYEAGLGFAVDLKKPEFVGRAALERNAAAPRRALKGLLLDQDDVPAHGAHVYAGERQVGVVTSATRSPSLERAIAMARLSIEHAEPGTTLEIGQLDGRMKRLTATVTDIPFIDPSRARARA
ncbi:DUF1989 domain-containing protein [Gymnodinialimonas sp. 2305UL16-5]|uniref:DUF1989 domain-containing protein n=1 Tax=Gymnodinialimonas mytili TaxID=3126503 RepID=UPI003095D619